MQAQRLRAVRLLGSALPFVYCYGIRLPCPTCGTDVTSSNRLLNFSSFLYITTITSVTGFYQNLSVRQGL